MEIFKLTRAFWDFAFDNPEKISPNHAAIYFFSLEHCNRLGWKDKFGFPSQMVMDAIGIKKHSTYIRYFRDLVKWGFFDLIQEAKNQYSSNIISLSDAQPKNGKALGKAIGRHAAKHGERHLAKHMANQKEYNNTLRPITNRPIDLRLFFKENGSFKFHKESIQKNAHLPAADFEHFEEQFILSREEDGIEYDDEKQVIAGFKKYINSCSRNYHDGQKKQTGSNGHSHSRGISLATKTVFKDGGEL